MPFPIGIEYYRASTPMPLPPILREASATTLTNAQFRTIADLMLKPGDQGGYAFDGITGEILCFPSDEAAKPVFNLIIHLGKGTDFDELYSNLHGYFLGALTEGATASDYKVITSPEPIADADAYFLLTTGFDSASNFLDLPTSVSTLTSSSKPVFLVTLSGIPNQGNWIQLRASSGLGALAPINSGGGG